MSRKISTYEINRKKIKKYRRILGIRGLIAAIKGKITKTPVLFKVKRSDIRFPFYLRVPSSDVYVYEQIFMKKQCEFQVRKTPQIIVDAGANIGLTAILFSNRFPESRIYAIEPIDSNFEILKMNIAPYNNIIPIRGALWNKNKKINLVDPGYGNWGWTIKGEDISEEKLDKNCPVAQGMTVDLIIKDQGIERIDLLKIDIEGAEREIFRDASSWIEKVDAIIIELHDHLKPGCNRSFYNSTNGFDNEWSQGEKVFLTRNGGCLTRHSI